MQDHALSLDQVDWKPSYNLAQASIGQIMVCFSKILDLTPKTTYEAKFYSHLKPSVRGLIDRFECMLLCSSEEEKQVKVYNLLITLPSGVTIYEEEHGNMKLARPKIGALIKAAKQRLEFIQKRPLPYIYVEEMALFREYIKMKDELIHFNEDLHNFETDFVAIFEKIRM